MESKSKVVERYSNLDRIGALGIFVNGEITADDGFHLLESILDHIEIKQDPQYFKDAIMFRT